MARRQSRVVTEDEDTELNMTPMLDVVFILLIFFIVTAVFVKEPGVDVQRPLTQTEERVRPTILVAVTSDDEIWVNRQVYQMNQLRNVLEQLLQENPRAEAMIQGDADAPVGTVLDVQEVLQQLGVTVTISTRPR
ncbi:biopolymer transport protein ExbD/TolR [Glycocaulis alkaliphilus]|uniref:Biopolymer transport protein ExbD/TolR n=1 Tax=Glycocaulis alkaliphilus TaxID=1434191 RepID=A0A3T0EBR9_9PROT|nr:biopolymer transporter ExbD [Glycocaulis alkaliphilus]AZU04636.1 biopolymer transport protein ExbD/TolR [Glycocaulis alkaliphilus]GGB68910.1 biopolymer transporter ExbD [Glycocaulis alkaliphilus]